MGIVLKQWGKTIVEEVVSLDTQIYNQA